MTVPLVSVVIPAYNRAHLLPETLESVLAQSYTSIETIVVDDGSTDNTAQLLEGYGPHIRVIAQANQGEGPARNTGIAAARGTYIAFVDSDDIWLPEKLERQLQVLTSRPDLRWAYSDAYVFDGATGRKLYRCGQRIRQWEGAIARRLLVADFIPSPTPVVHRSVFDEVGGFSSLVIGADWEMWLRIASRYPAVKVNGALAGYRVHAGMVSGGESVLSLLDQRLQVIARAVAFSPVTYASARARALSYQYILAGRAFMKQGDPRSASKMYRSARRCNPLSALPYLSLLTLILGGTYAPLARAYIAVKDRASDRLN